MIGRTKLENIEVPDAAKPSNSHLALNTITDEDGHELTIVRANMPFGELGSSECGTYFIAYSADPPDVPETMLRNMFLGNPLGNTDRILDFSTAHTGGLFFAPTPAFLDDPPPLPVQRAKTSPPPPHRAQTAPGSLAGHRQPERTILMDNLYRNLAPITDAAWEQIDTEASRTFKRHIAGRRVVDVSAPAGPTKAAVNTGHLLDLTPPAGDVIAHLRDLRPLVRLRIPFTVQRRDVDDVERGGSQDSDWSPVKDAAKRLAFAEDRAVFEATPPRESRASAAAPPTPTMALPPDPRGYPDALAQALSQLRLAGVDGPYSVLLSADAYTKVSETTEHGYPIREHLNRLVDGDIIWRRLSLAASYCPPAAMISTYRSARMSRSVTCLTTPAPSCSIFRRP